MIFSALDAAKAAQTAYSGKIPTLPTRCQFLRHHTVSNPASGADLSLTSFLTPLPKERRVLMVTFRGSDSLVDWVLNAFGWRKTTFWLTPHVEAKVHTGAMLQWETVKDEVFAEIRRVDPHEVLLIGHSLGGQLCDPASYEIYQKFGSTFAQ